MGDPFWMEFADAAVRTKGDSPFEGWEKYVLGLDIESTNQ